MGKVHGNFRAVFAVNGRFAVNFAVDFRAKIVPCPGAGHGGDSGISLVSISASRGVSKQLLLTLGASLDVKET